MKVLFDGNVSSNTSSHVADKLEIFKYLYSTSTVYNMCSVLLLCEFSERSLETMPEMWFVGLHGFMSTSGPVATRWLQTMFY